MEKAIVKIISTLITGSIAGTHLSVFLRLEMRRTCMFGPPTSDCRLEQSNRPFLSFESLFMDTNVFSKHGAILCTLLLSNSSFVR